MFVKELYWVRFLFIVNVKRLGKCLCGNNIFTVNVYIFWHLLHSLEDFEFILLAYFHFLVHCRKNPFRLRISWILFKYLCTNTMYKCQNSFIFYAFLCFKNKTCLHIFLAIYNISTIYTPLQKLRYSRCFCFPLFCITNRHEVWTK